MTETTASNSGRAEVWITGIGLATSLGEGLDANWDALNQRRINVDEKGFAPYVVHPWAPVNLDSQIPRKGDQRQMEAWQRIVQCNPSLGEMERDVEALLVNRVGQSRGMAAAEYYIAPIDACYRLVGLIRMHWSGLSGGTEVWQEIGDFFAQLRAQARVETEGIHA